VFALLCAGFFIREFPQYATHPLPGVVAVLAIALPSVVATVRWLGARSAGILLGSLALFAYAIESVGVLTGFPYSPFTYGQALGPLLFGIVPVILPLAYVPLVLGCIAVAWPLRHHAFAFVAAVAVLLTTIDLVLDPGAVLLGHWSFALDGVYYDVPFYNFLGWLLSGALAGIIALVVIADSSRPSSSVVASAVLMTAFWTGIALWFSLRVPMVIGLALLIGSSWWERLSLLAAERAEREQR
jgi:putative membrane protein